MSHHESLVMSHHAQTTYSEVDVDLMAMHFRRSPYVAYCRQSTSINAERVLMEVGGCGKRPSPAIPWWWMSSADSFHGKVVRFYS